MDFLRATTIEGNYPPVRRKNKNTTEYFMKTIGESFLTFFEQSAQLKSRPSLKESEETIQDHFKKMNEIIDSVDQHIIRRMENHENEVFSIVKGEIEQMREETQKVVEKLNQAIKDKNTEDEIWKLSNQLDYFKSQTYKLFQENKQVRQEMCLLRKQIKEYQIQLQSSDKLMQKLKRKQMKAFQMSKNKTMQLQKQKQLFFQAKARGDSNSHAKFKTTGKVIKTEPCYEREEEIEEIAPESIINIKVDSKIKTSNFVQMIIEVDDNDPLREVWTIPSEVAEEDEKHLGISTLPPVNFLQVESSFERESLQNSYHRVSRGVQTEALIEQCESHLQKIQVKPLAKVGAVESISMAKLRRQKQINFLKNGFHPVVYNKKIVTLQTDHNKTTQNMITPSSPSRRQSRHSRYMTNALNKGKMEYETAVGRRGGTKSTMK